MSTSKSAVVPDYDPKNHEGLELTSPYDPKISEALQPVSLESKYATENNWHEAPQVVLHEEPKFLAGDFSTNITSPISPSTPITPAPTYRTYPINRGSEDGISLTRANTGDLEKNKTEKKQKNRICGCTRTVFWLSIALGVSISVGAALAGGLIPINRAKDNAQAA